MDWKMAEKLLVRIRAVNLYSEESMIHNDLCDLIDMILDELRTLGDSSSVCKRVQDNLLKDRLPPADPFPPIFKT